MNIHTRLLSLLADGRFHSGDEIGSQLSVTRAAIWKRIQTLRKSGLVIYSVKGKGYRVVNPPELLDQEKLASCFDDDIHSRVRKLTIHTEVESTNQYLLDMIGHKDFHGHIALAEYQTRGRGRRGNKWISPFGSGICLSVGWYFDMPPSPLSLISLGTGVAVMRALNRAGINNAGLKWPNDIIWQNRKLGGTLVELRAESAGPCHVVTGVGINYAFPSGLNLSDEIDQPWVDIMSIQKPAISRNRFAAILISEIIKLLNNYSEQHEHGVFDEWRNYDCAKGKYANLHLPDRTVYGQIIGINEVGALLMSVNGKLEKYNVGEISLRLQQ